MICTLFICFLVLLSYDKIKNKLIKYISIILLIIVSYFCDWGTFAPLWVLFFYIFNINVLSSNNKNNFLRKEVSNIFY